jgi:hypothetical protein
MAQSLQKGYLDTNAAHAASHRCLQGEPSMAKPYDTQDPYALQDHHMVKELMVAWQVIDEKME